MGALQSKRDATPSNAGRAKSNLKKPAKKIDRNLIGQPTNFQHTGHIGIGDVRNPEFSTDKIKSQMATIAASINLDDDDGDKPAKATTGSQSGKADETQKENLLPTPPPDVPKADASAHETTDKGRGKTTDSDDEDAAAGTAVSPQE